jgi:hypothetical protein
MPVMRIADRRYQQAFHGAANTGATTMNAGIQPRPILGLEHVARSLLAIALIVAVASAVVNGF